MPRRVVITCVLGLLVGFCACDRKPKPIATTTKPATAPASLTTTSPYTADFTLTSHKPTPALPAAEPAYRWTNPHVPPAPPRRERQPGEPRTDPPILGGWLVWLQAEMECERLIDANLTGFPDPQPHDFDWIRILAWEHPAGATVLAELMREHHSDYARSLLLAVIGDRNTYWLHTPEVRQIVWEARGLSFAYTTYSNTLDSFGPDQLKPLGTIEFVRQLDVITLERSPIFSDGLFELYLKEAIERKSSTVVAILQDNHLLNNPWRDYLIRLARNRCLGQADPLTFKITPSPDDPKLVLIELALTDPELESFDLQPVMMDGCYVDVMLQASAGGLFKPCMKKWPPSQTLKRGQPYHTAAYLGFVRANKARVALKLFGIDPAPTPPSLLLPGPRLMPPMYVDLDLSDAK